MSHAQSHHLTPLGGRLPLQREISTHWQAGWWFLCMTSPSFLIGGDSYILGGLLIRTWPALSPFGCFLKTGFPMKPLVSMCFPFKPSEHQSGMDKNSTGSCPGWGWQQDTTRLDKSTGSERREAFGPIPAILRKNRAVKQTIFPWWDTQKSDPTGELLAIPSETTNAQNLELELGKSGGCGLAPPNFP